jgi:hypothetical protein
MGDKESGVNNIGFLKEHFPRNNGSEWTSGRQSKETVALWKVFWENSPQSEWVINYKNEVKGEAIPVTGP